MGKGRNTRHRQARAGARDRLSEMEEELRVLRKTVEPLQEENKRKSDELGRVNSQVRALKSVLSDEVDQKVQAQTLLSQAIYGYEEERTWRRQVEVEVGAYTKRVANLEARLAVLQLELDETIEAATRNNSELVKTLTQDKARLQSALSAKTAMYATAEGVLGEEIRKSNRLSMKVDRLEAELRSRPAGATSPRWSVTQWHMLLLLVHPDKHPPERVEMANKATSYLISQKPN